jgi:hypothetical protein
MKGYEIRFQVYAENEEESADARQAIVEFINEHAREGRAVTGRKLADAIRGWKNNPIVKNRIINYFK